MGNQILESKISEYGQDVLISILPEHAGKLYSGQKEYELRKLVPKDIPRRVFLYETGGVGAITGHVVVDRVISGSPCDLWNLIGKKGTTKERFFSYFKDRSIAHAFEVSASVKYSNPISLSEIKKIEAGFRVPQNFLYLSNLKRLHDEVIQRVMCEIFPYEFNDLKLGRITATNNERFLCEVDKHISLSYLETARQYGEKILEISDSVGDVEGIVTKHKHVFEVVYKGKLSGFVVLTEKGCGSLKTGPVILFEKIRNKGVGKKLRSAIHDAARKIGYRKIYCTAPASNLSALSYLLSSGYKIEGHLERHYHSDHDEVVFGHMLNTYRESSVEFARELVQCEDFYRLKVFDQHVVNFIDANVGEILCEMPKGWSDAQVRQSSLYAQGRGSRFKPRAIYVAKSADIQMVGLCVYKRGGSAKIVFISNTSHERSMAKFIQFIEQSLLKSKKQIIRKMYSHVPLHDVNTLEAFYSLGYRVEGVLDRPYGNCMDMVVFGKILN